MSAFGGKADMGRTRFFGVGDSEGFAGNFAWLRPDALAQMAKVRGALFTKIVQPGPHRVRYICRQGLYELVRTTR